MAAHAVALLLYGALTIALTWPVAAQPGGVVPHDLGDPLLSTWTLWWNAHVLPFSDRWWDGLAFFPARKTLALSDHRVGLGIVTSPLIWAGIAPLAAHNVAFLATFFLSATAAYALCFTLTRSPAASFIGGLVFGFNPYRADHLPHLELLASYWLPVVLLSLHQWTRTRQTKWLALLAASLTMQALTCGYHFFFAGVLIVLWLLWFLPGKAPWRHHAATVVALAAPIVLMAPVLVTYREAHTSMGLARSIGEIEAFSADLIGVVTPPELLAFWNAPSGWLRPEGVMFPGATAVLLILGGLVACRGGAESARRPRLVSIARLAIACGALLMALVALVPSLVGPVEFEVLGAGISIRGAYKPLTIAIVLFAVWALTTERVQHARRAQSPLAFYVLATIAMWLFALGPTATLLGHRVMYKAPYSWLMLVPGFRDEFRVPARFAMLAVLTLSVAAAIAFYRLFASQPARVRVAAVTVLSAAIMAESWIHPFPVVAAPAALEIPAAVPRDAVIAELPFGAFEDGIAMYHAMTHGRPIVNGSSGYDPPHHAVLRAALNDGHYEALTAIAAWADVAIFVRKDSRASEVSARLTLDAAARPMASTRTHDVFLLEVIQEPPATQLLSLRNTLAVHALSATENVAQLHRMIDDDRVTVWETEGGQTGTESFTADLGIEGNVGAVVLSSGGYTSAFPRAIQVELSSDARSWREAWRGPTVARAVGAAIADPRRIGLVLSFPLQAARYVRINQVGRSQDSWAVAEFTVVGLAAARPPLAPPPRTR